MNVETKVAIGAGLLLGAAGTAWLMKIMVDKGHPEIAKLPVKAIDELSQMSNNHNYEKAAVSFMAKATEILVDERDNQNKRWALEKNGGITYE